MEWLQSIGAGTLWRAATVLMLGWLALFFGRTLLPGAVPLIERIARVSDPCMTAPLQRYARALTAVWCAYFLLSALLALAPHRASPYLGAWVWAGTLVLFIGEHRLRPLVFPGHTFPGLMQQLRDTLSVWRPRQQARD